MQAIAIQLLFFMAALQHVILFTFHAYGTWLPDEPAGYFLNKQGQRRSNETEARWYRRLQRDDATEFDGEAQKELIGGSRDAAIARGLSLYAVATEPTHLHLLVAWPFDELPAKMRTSIKSTLTRRLNAARQRRQWFGRGGHDRRVRDAEHFEHLRDVYFPKHTGWKWDRRIGLYREQRTLR